VWAVLTSDGRVVRTELHADDSPAIARMAADPRYRFAPMTADNNYSAARGMAWDGTQFVWLDYDTPLPDELTPVDQLP
jgi:hypothetical protein